MDDVEKLAANQDNRLAYLAQQRRESSGRLLSTDDFAALFEKDSIAYHTARVDDIFKRVFG